MVTMVWIVASVCPTPSQTKMPETPDVAVVEPARLTDTVPDTSIEPRMLTVPVEMETGPEKGLPTVIVPLTTAETETPGTTETTAVPRIVWTVSTVVATAAPGFATQTIAPVAVAV